MDIEKGSKKKMKRIVAKGGAANSIIMLTRVLLPDDESDVNAALREELEQNQFKVVPMNDRF
jgi:hypothetical protein